MKRLCTLGLIISLAANVRGEVITTPQTIQPKGDYAIARLELPTGLSGGAHPLFLGFRDGKLANFWFVTPQDGDKRLHLEESTVTRKDTAITGKVHIRSVCVSAWLTLDLKVEADKITGTYELDMTGTAYKSGKGPVIGTWQTKGEAVAPTGAWPSFWGPTLDMASQPQPKLVDDFAQAKPLWRSEVYVLTGYGNAPDSRYMTRALKSGNGGGGSSPVVADGTVYIYFYQPNQDSPPATEGHPYWAANFKTKDFKAQMEEVKANEREKNWVLNHVRPLADDVIVAIDAATGATKWTTVLPLRSVNVQTHKNRAPSPVPLVAGDTIYVPNIESRLYALDRATGKLKWESPAKFDPAAKRPSGKNLGPANPSPVLLGGTLLWAGSGLDPASGQEKWKLPEGYLVRWTKDGKDRIVVIQGYQGQVFCLDPADGKQIWQQGLGLNAAAPLDAVISGDVLVAVPKFEKGAKPQVAGFKLTETGLSEIWRDQPIQNDENLPITVADGKAYLLGAAYIRILDIITGKQVGELKGGDYGPGSNPWLGVVGDRFLLIPEGQHGLANYIFLDRTLKNLGPLWHPPHTNTSAYNSQPIIAPVVDGRVFLRGGDGIYCYDLRKKE